jgi:Flp pilus assembly protein TadG
VGDRGQRRRGALIVIIAVALPVFVVLAAYMINVAYMELSRTELRLATDFAARAGARTLSRLGDTAQAEAVALDFASRNSVAGVPLELQATDLEFGSVVRDGDGLYVFDASSDFPNAMRVNGNRGSSNSSIGLFFGNALKKKTFTVEIGSVAGQVDRDIAVVLDRSGSMASRSETGDRTTWQSGDPAPANSRWMKCVQGIDTFLNALSATPMDEMVSLVTYNQSPYFDFDLTLDYAPIPTAIDVYTQAYVEGMTGIGDGIEYGRQTLVERGLGRPWASKTIVVLTDGIHNAGTLTPAQAAALAAADGVVVHTITYGSDADQVQMQEVASIGNGKHWHAPNQTQLLKAFNEIAASAPTLLME